MFLDHVCVGVTTNFKAGHSFRTLGPRTVILCVHFERG